MKYVPYHVCVSVSVLMCLCLRVLVHVHNYYQEPGIVNLEKECNRAGSCARISIVSCMLRQSLH